MMVVTFFDRGFTARGHAGYAGYGQDIVCAGVSAILQTAALGLEKVAGVETEVETKEGYMRCRYLESADPAREREASAILRTAEMGLLELRDSYPGHVELNRR